VPHSLRSTPSSVFRWLAGAAFVERDQTVGDAFETSVELAPHGRAGVGIFVAAIVLAHNHPSGSPTPSPEDHQITGRLSRAGELLGIHVLDHVIVSDLGYVSFRERGILDAA